METGKDIDWSCLYLSKSCFHTVLIVTSVVLSYGHNNKNTTCSNDNSSLFGLLSFPFNPSLWKWWCYLISWHSIWASEAISPPADLLERFGHEGDVATSVVCPLMSTWCRCRPLKIDKRHTVITKCAALLERLCFGEIGFGSNLISLLNFWAEHIMYVALNYCGCHVWSFQPIVNWNGNTKLYIIVDITNDLKTVCYIILKL